MREVQVFDINGTNVALQTNGAVATQSSTIEPGYTADKAIDNNDTTFQHTDRGDWSP